MIPQFLLSIIAVLALVFAPLESLFALGSSDSSSANTYTGSSVIDYGLPATVTVPPFTGSPYSLAEMKATEGKWVSTDFANDITLTFTPVDDRFFDEDGNAIPDMELDHDPQLTVEIGCTQLAFTVTYVDERLHQLSSTEETKVGSCTSGSAERAKFKLLMSANPKVFVDDDVMWLASRTQVMRFDRT